jgi:lysozyme family protein
MNDNFDPCLDFTLLPDNDGAPYHVDSGGGTSWGVTRETWSRWIGHPASVADMKAITKSSVSGLYHAWFWHTIAGNSLPLGVDLMVFDMGVTSGTHHPAVQLQEAIGFTGDDVDGDIGPETLAATQKVDPIKLIELLTAAQESYYRSCREFPVDGNGWLARLQRRSVAARAMIPASPTT